MGRLALDRGGRRFFVRSRVVVISDGGKKTPYKKGPWFDDQVYFYRYHGDGLIGRNIKFPLPGSDKRTFKVIDLAVGGENPGLVAIGKDRHRHYHLGKPLPFDPIKDTLRGVQPAGILFPEHLLPYFRDKSKVYHWELDRMRIVSGANPTTFQYVFNPNAAEPAAFDGQDGPLKFLRGVIVSK